jgi:1A family penicillin-binding protein
LFAKMSRVKRILIMIGYQIINLTLKFFSILHIFYCRLRKLYYKTPSIKFKGLRFIGKFAPANLMKKTISAFYREKKFLLGIIFSVLVFLVPAYIYSWYRDLPRPEMLAVLGNNRSTKILDKEGRLLYEIYTDRRYEPVKLAQIPEYVVKSTLAIEDDEFYSHRGIRPLSIVRAAKATIMEDELQGGSTITQQLIKNVLLTPERTMSRKIKEVVLAFLVEEKYTKDEILEMYFNNTPYGGTAWGIQAASQKYFGKNVGELTLAEAAVLAGLPSAPTAYSPFTGDIQITKGRQKIVLDRMVSLGYIDQLEADLAYEEELNFAPQVEYINAPHFVWYIKDLLEQKYGPRTVNYGGLTVTTTLDLNVQQDVEKIVKEEVEKSSYLNITNGAALVLEPKTGGILAYVGSKDYFLDSWGAYDVLRAQRQPGSSIKPVTYALALSQGLTTASTVQDSPVVYKNSWETYKPVNYDGRYHGTVTLRQALANSYNIPAVRLAARYGADNIVDLGRTMGLKSWEVDGSYGISVTLGGKDVVPLELANVYATLARGGVYKELQPITSVLDANGNEIYSTDDNTKRVLKEETAYLITHVLSDYYARLPAFGTNNYLSIRGREIAVKTGTTDLKRDNWTIGYTPSYTAAVWVGNNDNAPMNQSLSSGLSGAAPMWNRVMTRVLENTEPEKFAVPENIVVRYDEDCKLTEVFVKGSKIPNDLCPDDDDDEDQDKDKKNDKKDRDD